MRQKLRFPLILFLTLVLVASCASVPKTSTQTTPSPKATALKTLEVDKQIYDTTFKTLALLDSQGKLPAKVKAEAIRLGNLYLKAHNVAVQALLGDSPYNLATVRAALDLFLDAVAAYTTGVQ
jgi:hypothetical protein